MLQNNITDYIHITDIMKFRIPGLAIRRSSIQQNHNPQIRNKKPTKVQINL